MSSPSFLGRTSGIVLAADVNSLTALRSLAGVAVDVPEVVAFKVGFSTALRFGLRQSVRALRDTHPLPVIYDHQKAGTDIPQMAEPFSAVCREAGVTAVIIFPQAGPRTLDAFVVALENAELEPIVGLVMTHPAYLASDGGYVIDAAPDRICEAATRLRVRSWVLPGNKPDIARYYASRLPSDAAHSVLLPGVGRQGGMLGEAVAAVAPHRAFPIVGAAVYDSPNQGLATQTFALELRAAAAR